MTVVGESFIKGLGTPNPRVRPGIGLEGTPDQDLWEMLASEIGAGWFLDGFAFLFGKGINDLGPCVDAWSFLCPPYPNRRVIGRNAYGALLVLDVGWGNKAGGKVWLLDPTRISFFSEQWLDLISLVGDWLPERRLPGFLDRKLYDDFVRQTGQRLDLRSILALKVPLSMGGTMTLDNVQVEDIEMYYRSTAPIYERAMEKIRQAKAQRASQRR
jgi:hypothetical protein